MITAGSSMDDIVMIVFYTSFLSVEGGGNVSAKAFINIPVSIITGIAVGIIAGLIFSYVFKRFHLRDSDVYKRQVVDSATKEMCGQVIYPAAVLKESAHAEAAQEFLAFLKTHEAAEIFEGVGFTAL